MRVFAWILIVITVLCGLLIGYSLWAAGLRVEQTVVQVVPATQRAQAFESLKVDGQWNAVKGVTYQDASVLGDASAYEFHIYQAQVRNFGFLGAQWAEINPGEYPGAILLETQEIPPTVAAFSQTVVQAMVLAEAGSEPVQQIDLTYFVFGRPYRLVLTANRLVSE